MQTKPLKVHKICSVPICVCAPEDYAITLARLGTCWRVTLRAQNQGYIIAVGAGKSMDVT